MKKKINITELLKTVAVCVLLVSLICFCTLYLFGFEKNESPEFTQAALASLREQSSKSVYSRYFDSRYILPYFIGVRSSDGKSRGTFAGYGQMNALYSGVSEYLSVLFGEDGGCSEVDGKQAQLLWSSAKSGDCIYIGYRAELPKNIIFAMTFPDRIPDGLSGEYISELIIYPSGIPTVITNKDIYGNTAKTELYSFSAIGRNNHGQYFVYTSEYIPKTVSDVYFNQEKIFSYNMTDAVSFEFASSDAYLSSSGKLTDTTITVDSITTGGAVFSYPLAGGTETYISRVVGAFSLNYEKAASYKDSDGSVTYLEEGQNVKISSSGTAVYTVTRESGGVPLSSISGGAVKDGYSPFDYVGASLILLSKLDAGSDAKPYLSGIYKSGDSVSVTFGYTCDNFTVADGSDGNFIRFEFNSGMLVSASFRPVSAEAGTKYQHLPQNRELEILILTADKTCGLRPVFSAGTSGSVSYAEWQAFNAVSGGDAS